MGLFGSQLSNVVEWADMNDETIFWKWSNDEIKKGSRLIIRPGQDAIFMYNGRTEGIFTDEGNYDINSDIIPFLSTLKGFKFGFNSGIRAEVLFVNTREFVINWGTKNAINLPVQALPGGMPIRAFGNFTCKVGDYNALIDKVAGTQARFTVDDIRGRVVAVCDQLLMKWISKEGKDMFNIQANADAISKGIQEDLDMELIKIGITVTGFQIQSVSYPDSVRQMQEKAAGQSMVGNINNYTQMEMADGMSKGNGGNVAGSMAQMQMGMMMGQQMANQMAQGNTQQSAAGGQNATGEVPKFCPNCGQPTNGSKFCPNCGTKLV